MFEQDTATTSAVAEMHDAPLRLDYQLCFALYSATLEMTKLYTPILREVNLTYPQYLVLLVLWEESGLTVKEIGQRLHLDSGTLTPLLKRLEARKLVERARDPEDERQVRIRLAEAGNRLREWAQSVPGTIVRASGLEPQAWDELRESINQTRDRLSRFRQSLAPDTPDAPEIPDATSHPIP